MKGYGHTSSLGKKIDKYYKFVRTKMRPKEGTKIELQREICQILLDLLDL